MSQRLQGADIQGMEAKSQAIVAAGEGGVSGLSVEALMANIERKQAVYAFSERKQAEMINVNRNLQLEASGAGYQRNLLSINKPIEQPDYVGAVVGGAKTGFSAHSAFQNAGWTTPKPTQQGY